jgi:hypothetical protein
VPDYEELSPFYQRPSSAPAAGVDPTRQSLSSTSIKDPELQQSDFPSSTNVPTELPLPPLLRGANIRTYRTDSLLYLLTLSSWRRITTALPKSL